LVTSDVTGAPANGDSMEPAISGNGRVIAFASLATTLDGTQTNQVSQIYLAGNPLVSPVASGWWLDPNDPGRGFAIEERGNTVLLCDCGYTASGPPLWSLATQPGLGAGVFTGPLLEFGDGATLAGSYRPPSVRSTLGSSTLALTGPTGAQLLEGSAAESAQRFEFSPGGVAAGPVGGYPETGWWWNPSQPGQGLFLEVQGTRIHLAMLAYDGTGRATWYLADAPMTSPASFAGDLLQCLHRVPGQPGPPFSCSIFVGRMAINFASVIAGTATITVAGQSSQYPIQRYRF
jgi:hypothetical protein